MEFSKLLAIPFVDLDAGTSECISGFIDPRSGWLQVERIVKSSGSVIYLLSTHVLGDLGEIMLLRESADKTWWMFSGPPAPPVCELTTHPLTGHDRIPTEREIMARQQSRLDCVQAVLRDYTERMDGWLFTAGVKSDWKVDMSEWAEHQSERSARGAVPGIQRARKPGPKETPPEKRREFVEGWLLVEGNELQDIYAKRSGISPASLRKWIGQFERGEL